MDEFDKEFNKMKKIGYVIFAIYLVIIGFVIWVIIKLLQHFEVV